MGSSLILQGAERSLWKSEFDFEFKNGATFLEAKLKADRKIIGTRKLNRSSKTLKK